MRLSRNWFAALSAGSLLLLGCNSGGVGDPCVPEDEYQANFSGFAVTEANVEYRSVQCETRICLANHFQGRASCPYGQTEDQVTAKNYACFIPGSKDPVEIAVKAQLVNRREERAVYCSCRCDGADKGARYCECPSGFACEELQQDIGKGKAQLAGSYCIKEGTRYDTKTTGGATCSAAAKDCEESEG